MAVRHGYGKIAGTDALVFAYDTGDTRNSYRGEPTVNYVPGTYGYSLYAYASGPVDTVVLNEKNQSTTVKRYTITNAINTARAAIFPSGLTTGVAYTFSFKWRYNGSTTASPSVGINASKGNPEGGANNNSFTSEIGNTVNIGNGWYLSTYTFIFSSVPTGKCMLTFGIITGSTAGYVGETFDIYEAQFEIKNHRTQYSNGTRSSTQGLVDLTGNKTIGLSSTSFDTNAQPAFDGTEEYFDLGSDQVFKTSGGWTVENIVRYDSVAGGYDNYISPANFIGSDTISYNSWYWSVLSNKLALWNISPGIWKYGSTTIQPNRWYHVALVSYDNGTQYQMYLNGVAEGGDHTTYSWNASYSGLRVRYIGAGQSTRRFVNGEIPVTKIYNRALTAAEVRNNYNQYKGRFNI